MPQQETKSPRFQVWAPACVAAAYLAFVAFTLAWASRVGFPFGLELTNRALELGEILRTAGFRQWLSQARFFTFKPPLLPFLFSLLEYRFRLGYLLAPAGNSLLFIPALIALFAMARKSASTAWAGALGCALMLVAPRLASDSRAFSPEIAMAALLLILCWGLFASKNLTAAWPAVAAGFALAAGMLIKWTFALYCIGPVLIFLADIIMEGVKRHKREGGPFMTSRQLKNAAILILFAALPAAPWYVFCLDWAGLAQWAPADPLAGGFREHTAYYLKELFAPPNSFLLGPAFALCIPLSLLGKDKKIPLAALACVFVSYVGLTLIPHKEGRYIVPALPFAALTIGIGLANAAKRWPFAARGAILLGAALFFANAIQVWENSDYPTEYDEIQPGAMECFIGFNRTFAQVDAILNKLDSSRPIRVVVHPRDLADRASRTYYHLFEFELLRRNQRSNNKAVLYGFPALHLEDPSFEEYLKADLVLAPEAALGLPLAEIRETVREKAGFAGSPYADSSPSATLGDALSRSFEKTGVISLKCESGLTVFIRTGAPSPTAQTGSPQ